MARNFVLGTIIGLSILWFTAFTFVTFDYMKSHRVHCAAKIKNIRDFLIGFILFGISAEIVWWIFMKQWVPQHYSEFAQSMDQDVLNIQVQSDFIKQSALIIILIIIIPFIVILVVVIQNTKCTSIASSLLFIYSIVGLIVNILWEIYILGYKNASYLV